MLCRMQNCGTEGIFDKTDGMCIRCWEESNALKEVARRKKARKKWLDGLGYYERREVRNQEMLPYVGWACVGFLVIIVIRTVWLLLFPEG